MNSTKNQLPEGDQDQLVSALVILILDILERSSNAPEQPHQYLRSVFQRYPLQVVLTEIRNMLTALYFPQAADLAHLVMQYHDITLIPQRRPGGYCTTFIFNETLYTTPVTSQPLKAVEFALHMLDQLRAGLQPAPAAGEGSTEQRTAPQRKVANEPEPALPAVAQQEKPPSFIRIGRVALAIDRILYVKDDSTPRYQSVRVGLAGGIDMRVGTDSASSYMHTQEMRFIGEEARAFLDWHRRWTLYLPTPSTTLQEQEASL